LLINAKATSSAEDSRDIIKDSKLWGAERKARKYHNDPYSYLKSNAWAARKRAGPAPGYENSSRRFGG
jgi:hypothetical protein